MLYNFNPQPLMQASDSIIATALNGVVYSENNRIHVKTNTRHFVYKFDGSTVGWYARNLKNNDDVYLGVGASPSAELEDLKIKNTLQWNLLKFTSEEVEPTEAELQARYESMVESLIREQYTVSQELAILRQQESKAEEYLAYYDYCEECKDRARQEIFDD